MTKNKVRCHFKLVRLGEFTVGSPSFHSSFLHFFLPPPSTLATPSRPSPSSSSLSSSPLSSLLSSHCVLSTEGHASSGHQGDALGSRFDSLSKWIHLPLLSVLLFLLNPPSSQLSLFLCFFSPLNTFSSSSPSPSLILSHLIPPSSHCHPFFAPCNLSLAPSSISHSSCHSSPRHLNISKPW